MGVSPIKYFKFSVDFFRKKLDNPVIIRGNKKSDEE